MKKFLLSTVFALHALAVPVGVASAQDRQADPPPEDKGKISLVASGLSHHFGQRSYWDKDEQQQRPWNEVNLGGGLEYRLNHRFHLAAGTYRNSIHRQSFYVGVGIESGDNKTVGFGLEGGLITGYEIPVVPSLIPYVRFGERDGVNLKVMAIPPVKNLTPAVVALQLRVPLGKT